MSRLATAAKGAAAPHRSAPEGSRSTRVDDGLEKFREAILDFRGVEEVGQGFVDEVFRVWARAHRRTRLTPVEMSEPVEFMVRRGTPR